MIMLSLFSHMTNCEPAGKMWAVRWLLVVAMVMSTVSSQKLFFRSHKYLQKELEKDTVSAGINCPGKKSACPPGNTCCMTTTMAYGCCPLPNAMCCMDKRHCCPFGTRCDVSKRACISGQGMLTSWYERKPAIDLETHVNKEISMHAESVICPDGEHQCADGQTCCRSAEGYACCPLPHAVCCSDQIHCCPTGTTCDISHGRCVSKETGEFFVWIEKIPKMKSENKSYSSKPVSILGALVLPVMHSGSVKCDDKHTCPTGNTCCKMENDEWGCCPEPQAVCCGDHIHCCPEGTTCDVSQGKCTRGDTQLDWYLKQTAIQVVMVKCDNAHECPSGNTCCKLESGSWGCCPLPKAICCGDHIHCCPQGTTCDVSQGKCTRGDTQLDWYLKQTAIQVVMVKCDATHECPSGNTCCKLESGSWGCCPLPKAVCCGDHIHCCPEGTTCDVSQGKCTRGDTQLDWYLKQTAIQVVMVKCDATHECPSGNTCCKLSSGSWGCCPLPKAVCCADHIHCCPEGTTCDVSHGKCTRGDTQLDWYLKQTAIQVVMVKCDATHECPSGNTCCKLSSGSWGCCPLPKAVCCGDHIHCCPQGTTCDVSQGKCTRGDTQLDWYLKQTAIQVVMVKCDATHECPSGNTCCKLESGSWGCCPLPKAVCCGDHIHCCPQGTTCDVSQGKCTRGDTQLDWYLKQTAIQVVMVKCDATHECPSGNTCCKLESGSWGCCPLPKAVCCGDHIHCCPEGTTCDVSQGKCTRGDTQLDWYLKQTAIQVVMVKCDATHECPSGNTCCKLSSGSWGCCPLPKAVCCGDHIHCCPQGTTCDVSHGKCTRGDTQLDWYLKQTAIQVVMVKCDATHECPSGNTCCKLSSGSWGCCPLPKAVCCGDHIHCCPQGTTCDVSQGKCTRGDTQLDWYLKQTAIQVVMVKCDATHECPSGNTCCKLESGSWGCCPLPKAVCCGDHIHCCPQGTTCDVSQGKCTRGDTQLDWYLKQTAIQVLMVKCDATHECPSDNTCCKLESGSWGCCPLPKAVCCGDHIHCCPQGTTCDVSQGKCTRGDTQLDCYLKQTAIQVLMVKCDATHECPSGNTCCKLESGSWGCCPLPKAVCCGDHIHCCPEGTTCDVSQGKCTRGDTQLDWHLKQTAIQVIMVKCDATHECPSGNTCCKLESGSWGCCPLPKAVCCGDHIHCCPQGTTCDVSQGKCTRGDTQLDWYLKQTAIQVVMVKCDATHECPSGNTCCKLESGSWGCCPLPKAVCCGDHIHCCPQGTTCDVSQGKCTRGDTQLDWYLKQTAIQVLMVKCDATHECPSDNTCCKLESGSWGCCPLPKAVCCGDHIHCCPQGTTCDVSQGKCTRGDTQLDCYLKQTAIQVLMVKCDATHECPSGNTCCKLESGSWGCCPLPKAVCCGDHIHCCPEGTTCDVSQGKCTRGDTQLDWHLKQTAIQVIMVKCDATHECPSGNTCCKLESGSWGCCPLPKAVCCGDHIHCCPQGTTCDVSQGKCTRGDTQLDWYLKQTAIQVVMVKCDATHECPSGNTCCKLESGSWGCCPLPKAVCCGDHIHCCPQGTTCDVSQGKCTRGDTQLDWYLKQTAIQVLMVKCDATHECPSDNTCCKLESGSWGCCPLPKAVCCGDHIHCCPQGTTCDVSQGKCTRGDTQLDCYLKQTAIQVLMVKCDATHECPSGNTCCKLESGSWGCCPLPKAVCCGDHIHCCPEGTTCDVSQGKCTRGDTQLDWHLKQTAIQVIMVKCDATHECPSGNTCCKLESGSWGCCPLPKAVCCGDHIHCCPQGTTCDVSQGKCTRGDTQLDWYLKQTAIQVVMVKCDATHECPSGNTCCKLESGSWGCCPLPKAVCCGDHIHCCPQGTTCDVSQGKCTRGDTQLDWYLKQTAIQVLMVKCDATHECPSGNTCCKLESGSWGCCPLPKAVCCGDHIHCCPQGTTCDVSQGKCTRGDTQLDWYLKQTAIQVVMVKCDATHECPSGNTCCKLESGSWGCCPLPKAVCCGDHIHCCPQGTTCDVSQGKCTRGDTQLDWYLKQTAIQVVMVKCDATHECPSGNTCCKLESGSWGCCPLPKAVCCGDHIHCCPQGTTCDVSQGKCTRGDTQLDWYLKQTAIQVLMVKCDATHECPSGNTCCKLESGSWGCCPLPKAVCCADHIHCCPEGTTCDVSHGKCTRGDTQLDWYLKQTAIQVVMVKCDATHECPSGNTCCKLSSGSWGCCPLPKAVCCGDHIHCCPQGTTCNVSQGKCTRGDTQLVWYLKQTAIQVVMVKCDATHECPSGNTCCKLESGSWGCCPLPKAVCCGDHIHCCPEGTTCDVSQGKCTRGDTQLDWYLKQTAIQVVMVKCDATHECQSGNTCCKLSSGLWGCCPLPKAVCCEDHTHCCPEGTTCDVTQGKCTRGDTQLDWYMKLTAIQVVMVKCDRTHECPSDNTCCKLSSGSWGCCPLPKAVCCSDDTHCCPFGTTCDSASGKCNRGSVQLEWFRKRPAILKLQDVICPDGSECQDGQTCCAMNHDIHEYGCCPLPNAVCCSDGEHCCPEGYRCDLSAGTCVRGTLTLRWIPTKTRNNHLQNNDIAHTDQNTQNTDLTLMDSTMSETVKAGDVHCPGGTTCPDHYSCCDNGQGGYNCCPMPNGVCCDDHQYCCPQGYICGEQPATCRIPETRASVSNFIRKLGFKKAIPHI